MPPSGAWAARRGLAGTAWGAALLPPLRRGPIASPGLTHGPPRTPNRCRWDGKQRSCRLKAAFDDSQLKCLVLDAYWWSREAQVRAQRGQAAGPGRAGPGWQQATAAAISRGAACGAAGGWAAGGAGGQLTGLPLLCAPPCDLAHAPAPPRSLLPWQEPCAKCSCNPADVSSSWDTRLDWAAPAHPGQGITSGQWLHPAAYTRAVHHYAHLLSEAEWACTPVAAATSLFPLPAPALA